jgi:hypothetical protein
MTDDARRTADEAGKNAQLSEDEKQEIARIVGMGALKYFILKVDARKNMLFNPEESIDFNGNTGPFIQYTYARIRSILRKAAEKRQTGTRQKAEPNEKEVELIQKMADFPATFLKGQIKLTVNNNGAIDITWHNYDAEKGAFPFSSNLSAIPIYYLPVPIADGPAFRQALSDIRTKDMIQSASFMVYQHFAQIAEMDITLPSGKVYHYVNPGLAGYTGPIVKYSDLY